MSDPTPKRRGNPAMRAGAPSLNPRGRPKLGASLADAFRTRFPNERIVELAEKLAESAQSEQVRLAALTMIAERTNGKVRSELDMNVSNASAATDTEWMSLVPVDARKAELDRIRALRAQYATDVDDEAA